MNTYPTDWKEYLPIFFVFLRWIGFSLLLPGFSLPSLPKSFKVLMSLSLAFAFYPFIQKNALPPADGMDFFLSYVVKELVLGFILGFVLYLTFEAVALAFQFVSQQMGLNAQGMLDPMHPNSSALMAFQSLFCLVLFFMLDFHHLAIQLFFESYKFNRLFAGGLHFETGFFSEFLHLTFSFFVLALKVAAPFHFILFLLNVGFGILNKFVPQFNLIYFSFPLSFLLGLFLLFLTLPEFTHLVEINFEEAFQESLNFFKTFG